MMGPRQVDQAALFYEFSLERHVPATHLLRSIDRFVRCPELPGAILKRVDRTNGTCPMYMGPGAFWPKSASPPIFHLPAA